MMVFIPILLPALMAPVIWFAGRRSSLAARVLLLVTALLHAGGTIALYRWCDAPMEGEYLGVDPLGLWVVSITSLLFLCVSLHAFFWLPMARKYESGAHGRSLMSEHLFCSILVCFLSTMTLVALSRNFGLLWVAVEATTLASAPLICFHRSAGSLEAMWKYLLICSVGIGLALFGTLMLGVAIQPPVGAEPGLGFTVLGAACNTVNPAWFKAAFIFCFAGYGLKMGLAPFHTWLPDAHSEAPSMVSVLLSGALLNCSFLGIVRVLGVAPASLRSFCNGYLVAFGVLSLVIAAFFIIRQSDYKRMLAYSSVEHMGLLAIFFGLGEEVTGLIHMGVHSLTKMMLFLIAGNILMACGTRSVEKVRGLFERMPRTAWLWVAGMFLICGTPPSPLFVTELLLVQRAGWWLGGTILLLLFAVFCGMSMIVFRMVGGKAPECAVSGDAERAAEKLAWLPGVLAVLLLGWGSLFIWNLMGRL